MSHSRGLIAIALPAIPDNVASFRGCNNKSVGVIMSKNIFAGSDESLDFYFKEINEVPLLKTEEEIELGHRIKKGDQEALDRLTTANLRFVVSVAMQYQNRGLCIGDLINEGNLGLIKAARRFDVSRGFKFISYAIWWIRQSILQALAEQTRAVRLPMNKIGALNKIGKVLHTLEQEYERKPSTDEIANALKMSPHDVSHTLKISEKELSLDTPFRNQDNNKLLDIIPNIEEPLPDDELMVESLQKDIRSVLSKLSEQESEVIRLYFGFGSRHSLTLEEIGHRFNLSRERIRQIKARAIEKLRHVSGNRMLKEYLG